MKSKYLSVQAILCCFLLAFSYVDGEQLGAQTKMRPTEIAAAGALAGASYAEQIDPTKFQKMPANLEKPLPIGVIFNLIKLYKINEATSSFEALIELKLSWHDSAVAFKPTSYGTDLRVFNMEEAKAELSKIWDPSIVITNLIDKPISEQTSLTISSTGNVDYIMRIKGLFQTKYSLISFPFDTQILRIQIGSNLYNDALVQFSQSQQQIDLSGVAPDAIPTNWSFPTVDFYENTIRGLEGYYYSRFDTLITMQRKPLSYLFAIAPLLLIVVVPTILTFYTDTDLVPRLLAWSGAILALIAMSFTLDVRYPNLEANSLISKTIGIISAYEFIMIFLTMTLLNPTISAKVKNRFIVKEAIKLMSWAIPMVFITLFITTVLLTSLLDNV